MHNVTNAYPPALMPSQIFTTYPIQYVLHQYYSSCVISEPLTSASNFNTLPLSEYLIPSVEEFLKKLDKDKGNNSNFTHFINAFIEVKITVKHIKDLNDNDFQVLGVKTIG
ncbi:hypothetical protein C1645_825832 [Glomus cerebriforme]|uniref:SAM domain-containing protein n=1 Tax=Glomus cerebriforme TaxID=658196 RepID=A0A397SV34_9GLOM|nr:hypothetical protein C1645_825832 [Glomus cerebriforme]